LGGQHYDIKNSFYSNFSVLYSGLKLSFAQEPVNCFAVITEIKGDVQIRKVSDNEFVKAYWGSQVFKGDQLKTSVNSDAVLTLSNKGIIRLGSGSTITITDSEPSVTTTAGNVKQYHQA